MADTSVLESKTDELERVVATYRRHLPAGALHLFRVDGLDRLDTPVATAAFFPEDGKPCEGFGYGLSEAEAFTGALGELSEESLVDRALASMPRERGTYNAMRDRHGHDAVIDPLKLCLPAGSGYDPATTEIDWVWGTRHPDGARVLLPLDAIAADEAQVGYAPTLFTPITNGLGAGLSLERALAHGLLELHQRDGNVLAYRALDRGVVVDLDKIEDAATLDLLGRLEEAGIQVMVKLAATDFEMANLYVVGFDPVDQGFSLQVTACGEAVHPDREVGLRKALTEFVSSRSRKTMRHGSLDLLAKVVPEAFLEGRIAAADPDKEEPRALRAMLDWAGRSRDELRGHLADSAFSNSSRVLFSSLPSVPYGSLDEPGPRLDWLIERLKAEGLDLYYVDFSIEGSPVRAVKVVVPGLEAETMSYHRIGRRGVERLRSDWRGRFLADGPDEGRARVRLTLEDEEALGGPVWLDTSAIDAAVGSLYPLYREPAGQAVQAALRRGWGRT